jgi:hypothetical protein
VRERIRTHNGDMRNFRLEKKYPLVTIPYRPMHHMHSVEEQVRALTTAAFHLQEKGILAFDVFYPKFEMLQARLGDGKGRKTPDVHFTVQLSGSRRSGAP